ncbi:hypothetical protein EXT68_06040 [Pectobacterium parmentieri]|uniref:Lipoprotein n=2 Tax=Pectobacterium parmentieri TaxID=1905730 RepID=A0A8B3F9V7_PECPM|nr:hypothetical protein [Pectobacterium parmentieri]MBI0471086.1 hypothetical protein [Pectobacterium parmentieri]MBI0493698.1 hypothetical protein [Pectobacterium parmentieri]MBI0554835.1 hypothetical protein [Pectobacterium parmentieri]MBI0569528.1 hypothetical protein [Pectobacterium parmentieri]MBI0572933.1 hypothetical protein [Pectobacterium parmentieri]
MNMDLAQLFLRPFHIKRWGVFIMCLLVSSCASTYPETDNITAITNNNGAIVAESDTYVYKFSDARAQKEYQDYYAFYRDYKDIILGVRVDFSLRNGQVYARYKNVIDTHRLTKEQEVDLRELFAAHIPTTMGKGEVTFSANGTFAKKEGSLVSPTDKGRLPQPIPVVINSSDNSGKEVLLAPLMVPAVILFPLFMMYGCATGPCV